jgi:hypothetical protein
MLLETKSIGSIVCQFLGNGEARRGFGSSFRVVLMYACELKNMLFNIFRFEAKAPPEWLRKKHCGARGELVETGRGYKWKAPRAFSRIQLQDTTTDIRRLIRNTYGGVDLRLFDFLRLVFSPRKDTTPSLILRCEGKVTTWRVSEALGVIPKQNQTRPR